MAAGHDTEVTRELDRLFRREAGRLVATLVKKLGPHHLNLAEDTAQEALAAAARTWPYDGLPDNPAAWLRTTAYRRAIDELRRAKVAAKALPLLEQEATALPSDESLTGDAELELLFLCCQPMVAELDRLALTLNIAFGFSAREVAQLFFMKAPAMSARLTRAKEHVTQSGLDCAMPLRTGLRERLPSVLKVVYLAFSLGFSPGPGPKAVREDVALEALRLARALTHGAGAQDGSTDALTALLSFQASRLQARTDEEGAFIRLENQDRSRWDHQLVTQGFLHLARAQRAETLSRYHIEAGIAAAHAAAPSFAATDWTQIVRLYQTLEAMTGSPVVALNHAAALSAAGEPATALDKLKSLERHPAMENNLHFHTAMADILHRLGKADEARAAFLKARFLPGSDSDLAYLDVRLAALD